MARIDYLEMVLVSEPVDIMFLSACYEPFSRGLESIFNAWSCAG